MAHRRGVWWGALMGAGLLVGVSPVGASWGPAYHVNQSSNVKQETELDLGKKDVKLASQTTQSTEVHAKPSSQKRSWHRHHPDKSRPSGPRHHAGAKPKPKDDHQHKKAAHGDRHVKHHQPAHHKDHKDRDKKSSWHRHATHGKRVTVASQTTQTVELDIEPSKRHKPAPKGWGWGSADAWTERSHDRWADDAPGFGASFDEPGPLASFDALGGNPGVGNALGGGGAAPSMDIGGASGGLDGAIGGVGEAAGGAVGSAGGAVGQLLGE